MNDTDAITPTQQSEMLMRVLDSLEKESKTAKDLLPLGVDTTFVQKLRSVLHNPLEAFNEVADVASKAFVAVFVESVKQSKLDEFVDSLGIEISGSKVSIWVYLKTEHYNFDVRSMFYSLRASLANSSWFEKVEIDFLVLESGEAELPPSFTKLAA